MQVLSIAKVAYNFLSILLIPTTSSVFAFFSAYRFLSIIAWTQSIFGILDGWIKLNSCFNDYKLYSSMILWFKLYSV